MKGRRDGNVFDLHNKKKKGNHGDRTIDPTIYTAFDTEITGAYKGQEEWIYINCGVRGDNYMAHMIRYSDIVRIRCPFLELVTLSLPKEDFAFYGRLAERLLLPIQDRRLRSIYLFEPDYHQEPDAEWTKLETIHHLYHDGEEYQDAIYGRVIEAYQE